MSEELRDIELGTVEDDSLLYMESSARGDRFVTMTGLDQLAKLSGEDREPQVLSSARRGCKRQAGLAEKATYSPIAAVTPKHERLRPSGSTPERLGYLDESD